MKLGDKVYNVWCIVGFIMALITLKPIIVSSSAWALLGFVVSDYGIRNAKETGQHGEIFGKIGKYISLIQIVLQILGLILSLLGIGLGIALLT